MSAQRPSTAPGGPRPPSVTRSSFGKRDKIEVNHLEPVTEEPLVRQRSQSARKKNDRSSVSLTETESDCIINHNDYTILFKKLNDNAINQTIKEELKEILQRTLLGDRKTIPTWKNIQTELSKSEKLQLQDQKLQLQDQLFKIRGKIATQIKGICSCNELTCESSKKCKAFGSKNPTSDIDITVENDDTCSECKITLDVKLLQDMFYALLYFFDDVHNLFPAVTSENITQQLKDIQTFLDLNVYFSNFAVPKTRGLTIQSGMDIDSFYISTSPIQYLFAIADYINHENKNKDTVNPIIRYGAISAANCTVEQMDNGYKKLLEEYNNIITSDDINPDALINTVSTISLYEDESYHTQGSFFDIVIMLQRKIVFTGDQKKLDFLRCVSFIENLCLCHLKNEKYIHILQTSPDVNIEDDSYRQSSIKYFYRAMRSYLSIEGTHIFASIDIPFLQEIREKIKNVNGTFVSPEYFKEKIKEFDNKRAATKQEISNRKITVKYKIQEIIEACIKEILKANQITGGRKKKPQK